MIFLIVIGGSRTPFKSVMRKTSKHLQENLVYLCSLAEGRSLSMLHIDVLKRFKEIFPIKDGSIEYWWPNGKNSIRVRLKNSFELVLTYLSNKKWRLETVESFNENDKLQK